ncbi:MAG: HAD hydrolase family protein [bacterium]
MSFRVHYNVVGIGDAENDHAFLSLCECSAAVANAHPMIKKHADFITDAAQGGGVTELIDREENSVINLLGVSLDHRPAFFEQLFPDILELRIRTGRPHWIVIDETHHLLPLSWIPILLTIPKDLTGMMFITVHPDRVSPEVLSLVDVIIAIGDNPDQTIHTFCRMIDQNLPHVPSINLKTGEAIGWWRRTGEAPFWFRSIPPKTDLHRHIRKYLEGELGEDKSFYFRGPEGKLKLRAQNFKLFIQISEGIDDETWMYHLRRHDYSRWFRELIGDEELADEAEGIENRPDITPQESRFLMKEAIEKRYTLPG